MNGHKQIEVDERLLGVWCINFVAKKSNQIPADFLSNWQFNQFFYSFGYFVVLVA